MTSTLRSPGVPSVTASLLLLLFGGCEEPFVPIEPNDFAYSIYGLLDASADTQWVRVTAIRAGLETSPGPIDAEVTLEEVETGKSFVMSDSLVLYRPANFDTTFYAYNFSTTMPLTPGRHYRLTATTSDGRAASATALIPIVEHPSLEITLTYSQRQLNPNVPPYVLLPARGAIRGMRHVGLVMGVPCDGTYIQGQEYLRVLQHREGTAARPHLALVEWATGAAAAVSPGEMMPRYIVVTADLACKRIAVAASGEMWRFPESVPPREVAHPSFTNNVEGGLGYVAGLNTYYFPFEKCVPLTVITTCRVRFDESSATLTGEVESRGDGLPLAGALVRLTGSEVRGFRTQTTDSLGTFKFRGVDPGVEYSLAVSAAKHEVHERSLIFADAETKKIGVQLIPE